MSYPVMNRVPILLVVVFISLVFLAMVRQFILAILLAAVFSAMAQPMYRRFERWFRGRKSLASATTLVIVFLIIFLPLLGILGIVAGQAISISQSVSPWIQQWISEPSTFRSMIESLPFSEYLITYQNEILTRVGQMIGGISNFLFTNISSITFSTLYSVFLFFIFLYTMFFFLKDGRGILEKSLTYLPLQKNVELRLLERFTSVTRATVKGNLVIALIQGTLGGLAFWVIGIHGALFWGTMMVFFSIIPAVGPAIIWLPAAIILAISGEYLEAAGLAIFGSLLIGSVDNLLRPWLVGRDTQMHELLILFSTLGGLSMFGLMGFIIGPIVAALFVTIWDIYAEYFHEYLSDTRTEGPQQP